MKKLKESRETKEGEIGKDRSSKKRRREDEGRKDAISCEVEEKAKSDGLDEIDLLFALKKDKDVEQKKREQEDEKKKEEKMIFFKKNSKSTVSAKSTKMSNDRSDIERLQHGEWVQDGLGGVFDSDGFTGRREDGLKVYKAHLFNKKGFGTTPDCPFDCDCCFI